METAETTEFLLAALASAERELARRRAAAATGHGLHGRPWWDTPRACVAMLARHEGASTLVSDALARTPIARWDALLPALDGHTTDGLRALRTQWAQELAAVARGERIAPTAVPPSAPPAPRPLASATPPPPPAATPPGRTDPVVRRDTSSAANAARLARWLDGVFGERVEATEGTDEAEPTREVNAWYEVAPRGDGRLALWLVCAPTAGFAPFVKVLTARCGQWERSVRRENLATLGARFEVAPTADAPTWTTGDAEDDDSFTAVLASLAPEGLPADRVTVFRLDLDGRAQRLSGTTVSRGARYAVLLPPAVADVRDATSLEGAWRLWAVEVPALVPDGLATELQAAGLSVGALALAAGWAVVPPARWELTDGGERVPVFDRSPVARLTAGVPRSDLTVLLHGGGATAERPLAHTDGALLALSDLAPGRYALEFTCCDRTITAAKLAFVIASPPLRGHWPSMSPSVHLGDQIIASDMSLTADLADGRDGVLRITAPPAMAARIRWWAAVPWDSGALAADAHGLVPLDTFEAQTQALREEAPEGVLEVDFGEWGRHTIHHRRTIAGALPALRASLRRAVAGGDGLLATRDASLATLWLRGVAAALGYVARSLAVPFGALALDDVVVEGARVRTVPSALLVGIAPGADLRDRAEGAARPLIDALCAEASLPRALATDGVRWWELDPRRSVTPRPSRLDEVLDDDEALAEFLLRCSAWR
jgi:hypothetical protein